MKILFVIPTLGKGGADELIVNLSSEMSLNADNNVSLLLFQHLVEDRYNISRINSKVRVMSVLSKTFSSGGILTRLIRVLIYIFAPIIAFITFFHFKLWQYDIIHINLLASSIYAPWWILLSKFNFRKRPKFIETFHSNWHLLTQFQKFVFRISWSMVDKVICEIGNNEVEIVKNKSFAKNVYFIPFGVPAPQKKDNHFLREFRKSHFNRLQYRDNNKIIIMTIATLNNLKKKYDVILNALSYVKRQGFSNFEYWICGNGPDQKLIEKWIINLGLSKEIKLLGIIDRPQQVIYLADIFIIAMVQEYTGIAGLQAGIASIPVIGVQTVAEYDGKDDVIWSSGDPLEIAHKIVELNDKFIRKKYGLEIKTYIKKKYDMNQFFLEYQCLFENLLLRMNKKL
jgi:glycosyltransferase involved in cell wall biosynthesis